jgi:cytochrome c oxidase subunit 2
VIVGAATFVVCLIGIPWLPDAASEEGELIDDIYLFASIISIIIFAIVVAVSLYAVFKFRAKDGDEDDGKHIHGHTGLEIFWTAIPTALVTAIAVWSGVVVVKNDSIPAEHRVVNVRAWQFAWSFSYPDLPPGPDGRPVELGELVLPVGESVELQMRSPDVIHSFWVPEWRQKQDVVPGITTLYRITPTLVNRDGYDIVCTELCGIGHSVMRSSVRVLPRDEFDVWLAETRDRILNPPDTGGGEGGQLFASAGCNGCHALQAAGSTAAIGPDLDKVLPGQSADQVLESIVDPGARITDGYQDGVMPTDYGERLGEDQLAALVGYLVESAAGGS